jgi:hypothetical protein
MGHKGVSKRKPKKSNVGIDNTAFSNTRPGENSSSVQSLVKDKDALLNRSGTNPSTGSNKKIRKDR